MKAKLIALLIAAMTFGLGGLPASASPQSSNSLLGEAVPLSAAKRTIRIDARTRYVNVTEHETIKFESNGSAFAIYFRGALYGFDLNRLAPPNALDHKVTVWIAPDPLYLR